MPYAYSAMKPKHPLLAGDYISYTSEYSYDSWQSVLEGGSASAWKRLSERFREDARYGLLRGMAVFGVKVSEWESVFDKVYYGGRPFETLSREYLEGKLPLNWTYFANLLAQSTFLSIHYPPLCPEWLFPYGYTQQEYVRDLGRYWANIHDDYYKPWATTQLGQDSPEVARVKQLGEEARREIDRVARYSEQHLQ